MSKTASYLTQTLTLNTGASIPIVGLGVFASRDPSVQAQATPWVLTALQAGYRHIDTAWIYGTEKPVGDAIKASGIPREQLFITTKLPWNHTQRVQWSIDQSLKNAGLDYFDLYLMHWPHSVHFDENEPRPRNPDGQLKLDDTVDFNHTWAEMEKALASGKVRAIGLSNFSIKTLEKLFTTAKVTPAMLQIELHPYLAQNDLLEYCRKKGILVTAYAPTGYSTVRDDPSVGQIAQKHGVTPTQVILSWHVARGAVVIPKSADAQRQIENSQLLTLDPEDTRVIDALDRNERVCNKPDEHGNVWAWSMDRLGWAS
ncbi:reductase AKOR2 [Coniophora puteana RWD-64-598 SS2]|uniref:Reductase AKOR2 n=1 Tax=Coniophora puteana (strain RWD-64-598) TaxID=741705 RepID=A0A5M3MC63_CONPW|nr:reductase AKOR2 [Coniophora puteana RWD-64-598 SS2]EIW76799.1 reductase AKOR2 [Coniophora puteana RWD-64-598 SS2]